MTHGGSEIPTFQEGERVSAAALTKLAELAAREHMTVDAYVDALGVSEAHYPPMETWAFELAEDLDQWDPVPTLAYRRFVDPSANGGNGAYVTDCSKSSKFWVVDMRQVGYWGVAGATGAADIISVENDGSMGIIVDLRCPSSCICGEASAAAACGGGA